MEVTNGSDLIFAWNADEQYYFGSIGDGQFKLPTWSRCALGGWAARRYPAERVVRLLWLTCGERKQEIVPAAPAAWHTHLLSAPVLHLYGPLRLFPAQMKRQAGEINWSFIEALDRHFAPRTLKAHLQYPLHETLEMES